MKTPGESVDIIFDSSISFDERCTRVFNYQSEYNPVFNRFIRAFGIQAFETISPHEIPLIPIRAFKDGKIISDGSSKNPELVFKSSGTTKMSKSIHYVRFKRLYEKSIIEGFTKYFPYSEYRVFFYLPGYQENPNSSLIWMAKHLIQSDTSGQSKFITKEDFHISGLISSLNEGVRKPLLFGAAFGLMDLVASENIKQVKNLEIIETGGMKTHRREMSKSELRYRLSEGFQIPLEHIHSEYGMCELLSQMYAVGSERFQAPHWMEVTIRDADNPLRICDIGEEGKIGIIDLANIYSCPFLLTGDRGVIDESGKFRVLGRWNKDDMRGCNFLIDHE